MSSLSRDLRYAFRSLFKAPLLATVAVSSLALGIGANTAVFSLFDQVLMRLLPVEDPESLVMVVTRGSHVGSNRGLNVLSYPMFRDYREQNDVFDGVLCRRSAVVNLSLGDESERTDAELVSGNYFEVLGVRPALGRLLTMDDETAVGQDPVVVLGYDFWRERFEGDPGVLGRAIRLNGHPFTVVGVAAPGFSGITLGFTPKLHVPVTMKREITPSWDAFDDRRTRWVEVFARLSTGVSREAAEDSISALHQRIIEEEVEAPYFASVTPYAKERFLASDAVLLPGGQGFSPMRGELQLPLQVLMAFVALLLLITCANVSNLLVAKAMARKKEIAMRLAVGAGRRDIIQQLLVESALLALLGGISGLLVGYGAIRALLRLAPDEHQSVLAAELDPRMLLFCFAVSLVAAVLFGLVPALQAARLQLVSAIKPGIGERGSGPGLSLRKALVVLQVFLALLLVLGATLFVQSLENLSGVEPGFSATNLVRFKLDPMLSGYDVPRTKDFFGRLRERLETLPAVSSAGLAVVPIMEGDEWDSTVTVEGYRSEDGEDMNPHFNSISPAYFETLGIELIAGRDFDARDASGAKGVVIVNETFSRKYFGENSPLGYHIAFGSGPDVVPDLEIVGVVEDAKYEDLRLDVPRQVYVPYTQQPWATDMTVYLRSSRTSEAIFAEARTLVSELDASMPIYDLSTMEDQLDRSLAIERLVAFLSSAFGVLAAALAFVGLYGVTAYSVARRSSEIGLRMALGARASRVVSLVLKEVLTLTALGLAAAVPAAWWLGELVASELYGVAPRDPGSVSFAALALVSVTLIAGLVPAMRASRLDPVSVLRAD